MAAREWVTFTDPADARHEIRADLSFLLSRWECIFGRGCRGVDAEQPAGGCCTHGAFFSGSADEARVRAAAAELEAQDWERPTRRIVQRDQLDGVPARRTRLVDGACVFLNSPDFPAGAGCALHALALRTGRHPLQTKPDVCWQVPLSRAERVNADGTRVTVVTEFGRSSWGEGGAELSWWCTETASAHHADSALYRRYAEELTALIGVAAYEELSEHCRRRERGGRLRLPLLAT